MVLVVLTERNPLESLTVLLKRCYFIHIPLSSSPSNASKHRRGHGWDGT
jgi:hypothetical protein